MLSSSVAELGFPDGSDGKESACNAREPVPTLGQEDLEKGMATHTPSTPVFLLENPMDRGAWQAAVRGGCKESDTTERLTLFTLGD